MRDGTLGEAITFPGEASLSAVQDAARIPRLGHGEAADMAAVELDRFLALLRELTSDDWTKPTACTLWNVRQIAAHVAGAAASYARWSELRRQWSPRALRAHWRPGFSLLDALNQIQVDDRAHASPLELMAELRAVGPRAIANRRRLPGPVRALRLPMPALGVAPVGYLTDLIYTRDMWIHRLDIARATGREMALDASHDRRIVALMVSDLGKRTRGRAGRDSVVLDLTGPAGGLYGFGPNRLPRARVRLDATDFAWLAAGRLPYQEARARAGTDGDAELAARFIATISVPI